MNIHLVSIATNIYIHHWEQLIFSLDQNVKTSKYLTIHVFTNEKEKALEVARRVPRFKFEIYEIQNLKWPEATLLRYQHIARIAGKNSGIVGYIDSDMLINFDLEKFLQSYRYVKQITLVSHPGYWRSSSKRNLFYFYKKNPEILVKDVIRLFLYGGLGSWETNKHSLAYVGRSERKLYVCGGFWFGNSEAVHKMCSELSENVNIDLSHNIVAKWHDESHLNKWSSKNKFSCLSPEFCFVEDAANLIEFSPKIVAVEKIERTR